jgi:hypothetical protein
MVCFVGDTVPWLTRERGCIRISAIKVRHGALYILCASDPAAGFVYLKQNLGPQDFLLKDASYALGMVTH